MNAIVEQIMQEEQDYILPVLKEQHDAIAARARAWIAGKRKLLPVLSAFKILGAHVFLDSLAINVYITGDKEVFIKCWKLWRSVGHRLAPAEKGATGVNARFAIDDVRFCFNFSSTVCKRVKTGTKMVEQDIFETQCGTDLETIDIKELEGETKDLAPHISSDNEIPF